MDNTNLSFQEKFLIDNNKEERRKEGQFFTPESCADRLLDIIEQQQESKHIFKETNNPLSILEPSSGTGIFIKSWINYYQKKKIKRNYFLKCIELNEILYKHTKDKYENINKQSNELNNEISNENNNEISNENNNIINKTNDKGKNNIAIIKDNFLLTPILDNESCHLIIGNPPYFELKKENKTPYLESFGDIIQGRPNIYALFLYKCILLLKRSGICGLILSPSFFNGSYFSELRNWMYDRIHILKIEKIEDMKGWDTKIPLVYFVFQKTFYNSI